MFTLIGVFLPINPTEKALMFCHWMFFLVFFLVFMKLVKLYEISKKFLYAKNKASIQFDSHMNITIITRTK